MEGLTVDWELVFKGLAPVVSLLGILVADRRRSKLILYLVHGSVHPLPAGAGIVHTHAIVIANTGRHPATNVRIHHDVLPESVNVYPAVPYTIESYPGGRAMVLQRLVPHEQIQISYLYVPPLTWQQVNAVVTSDDGYAKFLRVSLVRQFPPVIYAMSAALIFIGLSVVVYYVLKLARIAIVG